MDRVSQSAVENFCADLAISKFGRWVMFDRIWSDVLVWSSLNRHKYAEDRDGARQIADMYTFVAGECEKVKAMKLGYKTEDLAWYSISYLRELVEQVCAGQHSTRLDCAYADVERALYRLVDPGTRAQILGHHAGWLEDAAAYEEALVALQETLGGKRPKGL